MNYFFSGTDRLQLNVCQLESILPALDAVIIKNNFHGKIHYVSSNVEQSFGYQAEELLGKRTVDFIHFHDRGELRHTCMKVLNGEKQDGKVSIRILSKAGSHVWMNLHIFYFHLQNGKEEGEYLTILKKIPVEQEESLLQSDKLSVLGQLAAGIAHEIRNPLTSLKGFIQLMKSDRSFNEQYLKIMESEINTIEVIAKELMVLARPNPADYRLYNLNRIFESSMNLLEGEIFQKRIKVHKKVSKDPTILYCDEQKIKQVIINIIKNAIEAMEGQGNIYINIQEEADFCVISIKDEGKEIPKDILKKLGKPFFTTKSYGNGLGLMMCFKIIEEHYGKIQVDSQVNIGTEFKIYLPLGRVEASV